MIEEPRPGTFADGYDLGLRDAREGKPRAMAPLKRWAVNPLRRGYDAGYSDGTKYRPRNA